MSSVGVRAPPPGAPSQLGQLWARGLLATWLATRSTQSAGILPPGHVGNAEDGFGLPYGLWGRHWHVMGRGPAAADPHDLSVAPADVSRSWAFPSLSSGMTSSMSARTLGLPARHSEQASVHLVHPGGCSDSGHL